MESQSLKIKKYPCDGFSVAGLVSIFGLDHLLPMPLHFSKILQMEEVGSL
jgi:hypothetical protein